MEKRNFSLVGYSGSFIAYESMKDAWKIKMTADPKKYAVMNGTLPPFGTHHYHLSPDLGNRQIVLNINACNDIHTL